MRYSPSSSLPSYTDDDLLFFSSFSLENQITHPTLMSQPLFDFHSPHEDTTFGSSGPSPSFQGFQDPFYSSSSASASAAWDQDELSFSQPAGNWQHLYGDSAFAQQYQDQQQHAYNPHQQQLQSLAQHPQLHRRALSNSSMTSAGPDSPYSRASSIQYPNTFQHSSHGGHLHPHWDGFSSPPTAVQHLPTPINTPTSDSFVMPGNDRRTNSQAKTESAHAARQSMRSAVSNQQSSGVSKASRRSTPQYGSIQSQDGVPMTPPEAQQNPVAARPPPKFDRTMSDVYQDELYNPHMLVPAPHQNSQLLSAQPNTVVSARLNDANRARSITTLNRQLRQISPFRPDSQFSGQPVQMQTAAAIRAQSNTNAANAQYQQHQQRQQNASIDDPQTVSPKDAFPEQQVQEEEHMPSLFPTASNQSTSTEAQTYAPHNAGAFNFSALAQNTFNFTAPSIPASVQVPDIKYNYGPAQADPPSVSNSDQFPDYPATLRAMESTKSEDSSSGGSADALKSPTSTNGSTRPSDTTARSGTYTCTYHGCTRRFPSPSELQKHKREDHRSTHPQSSDAQRASGSPTASEMTQAGPHKCSRINPSTGKPCNTIFSRPYDLTRHEDTIHAERKKVRCEYCTEEKTFSRADALTRHLRVVHPNVGFSGKNKRRHMD